MMRAVVATLAVFTLAGGLTGQQTQGARTADGTGPSIIGTLLKYESTTRTLTLTTTSGRKSVVLSKTAQVRQGSRQMAATELPKHIGSKAKVRYTESRGILTADSVMLAASPG